MGNFKDESRRLWATQDGVQPNHEQMQIGCLQRIADATESMASNYNKLISDRDMYERWWKQEKQSAERMAKRISALKGVITKLKKKNERISNSVQHSDGASATD